MRHGERAPVDTYPNDPYIKDDMEPNGWGQLTNVYFIFPPLFKHYTFVSYKSNLNIINYIIYICNSGRKKEPIQSRIIPAKALR